MLDFLATQPPDFFHDPFGQFIINLTVAIVVGILTALVAIWIFRKQRTRKVISYYIVSNAPIAILSKTLQNRVAVQVDGQPVKDARQVVLTLCNEGNVAVKRDDYDEPMKLIFHGSKIVGSDILNTYPPQLINSLNKISFVKIETDSAELEKFLLNPKQSISLTFILEGAYNQLEVTGRIIDGKIEEEVEYFIGSATAKKVSEYTNLIEVMNKTR